MIIKISGHLISEQDFSEADIQDIKDFFYQYGEQFNWNILDIAQLAAGHFCFRDNYFLEIDDEYDYLSDSIKDELNDRYCIDLYDSEIGAIYTVMEKFKKPLPKNMDIE